MKNPLLKIAFLWGICAAISNIVAHLCTQMEFIKSSNFLKMTLETIGLIVVGLCFFKAIKQYRNLLFKGKIFTILQALKISTLTIFIFSALYLSYLLVFVNFISPDFIQKYKTTQIINIELTNKPNQEKNTLIEQVNQINTMYYLNIKIIQTLIFSFISVFFISAFLQRKIDHDTQL